MSICDHSSMGVTGDDRSVTCPGCGQDVGKFTSTDKDGAIVVFTTKAARDAHEEARAE